MTAQASKWFICLIFVGAVVLGIAVYPSLVAFGSAMSTLSIKADDKVDTSKAGTYKVAYTASDSSGNTTTVYRTVYVVDPAKPLPIIFILGSDPAVVEFGSGYTDEGASAVGIDGKDASSLIVVKNEVNLTRLGTYTVTYTVKDAWGNTATEKRTVKVVDTIKPLITLVGSSWLIKELNVDYTDEGAVVHDNYDGVLGIGPTLKPAGRNLTLGGGR